MFGLLCRRSLKKLEHLIQNDLQKPEKQPQDASKTALPKKETVHDNVLLQFCAQNPPHAPQKPPKCPPRGPQDAPKSLQEPQRPPKYVPKAYQQHYLAASWPRRDARSVYNSHPEL